MKNTDFPAGETLAQDPAGVRAADSLSVRHPEAARGRLGQFAIFLCAVLWSTSGLFIKLVDWNPVIIAGTRSAIAVLFLFALRVFSRLRVPAGGAGDAARAAGGAVHADGTGRPGGWKTLPRGEKWFLLAGGLSYAFTMLTFVIANKHTASANAILLQYTAPVWAAVLGWLVAGERPRWEHWGAMVLVFLGMLLFFRDGLGGGSFFGDILSIISGMAFGAHSVFLRMVKRGNTADSMLLAHVSCALFCVPFLFFYPPAFSPGAAGAILFMGVLQIGAASALFAWGIKRISAVQAMLTAMIEPVLNPLWVFAVTGERPSLSALLGGAIIIAAVVLSSTISAWRRRS